MTNHHRSGSRRGRYAWLALLALPCLGADECPGAKVYLSPANHGGQNIGCAGYNEDVGARAIAAVTAAYLQDKGYVVKVGEGNYEQNYADSNAWGANLHVPIHSNAREEWGCEPDSPKHLGGTWTMYRSPETRGQRLASDIFNAVKDKSPGTNDQMQQNSELLELKTQARAAYVEMGFHTFFWDVVWLTFDTKAAGEALGKGIHDHCLAVNCRESAAVMEDAHAVTSRGADRQAAAFDQLTGTPRPDIEDELRLWLGELHPELAATLTSVSAVDDTLVVDLGDIRGLGSSHMVEASGMPSKVLELSDLSGLVFQIDGEAKTFCDWVEWDCVVLTRPQER